DDAASVAVLLFEKDRLDAALVETVGEYRVGLRVGSRRQPHCNHGQRRKEDRSHRLHRTHAAIVFKFDISRPKAKRLRTGEKRRRYFQIESLYIYSRQSGN